MSGDWLLWLFMCAAAPLHKRPATPTPVEQRAPVVKGKGTLLAAQVKGAAGILVL